MEEIKNSRENPHQCGQCKQIFQYEKNLISHIENVHLIDDIKNCANFQIYLDLAKENKLSWDLLEKFKNAAQKCSNLDKSKELNDLLFQELKISHKRETDLKSKLENADRIYSVKIQLMEKICEEKKLNAKNLIKCFLCGQDFDSSEMNSIDNHIFNSHRMEDISNLMKKVNKDDEVPMPKNNHDEQKLSKVLANSNIQNKNSSSKIQNSNSKIENPTSKHTNSNSSLTKIKSSKLITVGNAYLSPESQIQKGICQSTGTANKERKCHFDVNLPNKKKNSLSSVTAKNTYKDDVLVVDLEDNEVDFPQKIVVEPKPELEEEEKTKNESEIRTRIYVDDMSFLDHETEIHYSSPNNSMELQDEENDLQKKKSETEKDSPENSNNSTAEEMPVNLSDEIAKNVQEILVYHTKKESVDKSEEKFSPNVTETDSTDAKTADEVPLNSSNEMTKEVKGILVYKR